MSTEAPKPAEITDTPPQDQFAASLFESLGKIITPDGNVQPADAKTLAPVNEPPKNSSAMTLGEELAERERVKKDADAAAKLNEGDVEPPALKPGEPPAAVPPTPPVTPAPPKVTIRKKEPAAVQPPPLPPTPAPAAVPPLPAPAADPDAAFIATLDDDQKAELEYAKFAEKKFPELKGKTSETLKFFKGVEDFAAKNPSATQEDLDAHIASTKPKWAPGQKRKVEHEFITEQASTRAAEAVRTELEPKIQATQKKQREQELMPAVDKAVTEFGQVLSSPEILPDPKMESIPPEVSKMIAEKGYAAALEQYPIEAPIVASSTNAAREWMRLSNGIVPYNGNDPLHKWMLDFVESQGRIYAAKPESMQGGKQFMPLLQYLETVKADPNAATKYWTFNDQNVLDLIAVNATLKHNSELSKLEKAGFKREKKKTSSEQPTPALTPAPVLAPIETAPKGSPRMKGAMQQGAGAVEAKSNPNADFLNKLSPGSAERIGAA